MYLWCSLQCKYISCNWVRRWMLRLSILLLLFLGPDGEFIMSPIPGKYISLKNMYLITLTCIFNYRTSRCWFPRASFSARHWLWLWSPRVPWNLWRYWSRLPSMYFCIFPLQFILQNITVPDRFFTCANPMEISTPFSVPTEPFSTSNISFVTGGTTSTVQPLWISMLWMNSSTKTKKMVKSASHSSALMTKDFGFCWKLSYFFYTPFKPSILFLNSYSFVPNTANSLLKALQACPQWRVKCKQE